jgi:LacI family transcriptional regulator
LTKSYSNLLNTSQLYAGKDNDLVSEVTVASKKSPSPNGITVFDVAKHAGVSIATVSRALSGNRPVSEKLRLRVQSSADQLGYTVNLVGRALRQKKTSTLGLVIPDLENPFFSSLAQSISRSFAASEVDVVVASSDNDIKQEKRAVKAFIGWQVDACVIIPSDEVRSAEAVMLASSHVPTIQFDRLVPTVSIPFVGCDNFAGMRLISEHIDKFVDINLQPLIFVGGGESSSSGRERSAAFLNLRPDVERLEGRFSFEWGQAAGKQILDSGRSNGTIVTAADIIALGVISVLLSGGHQIPEDFRVIGFDDVGMSYLAHPTLTTVRQPIAEMTDAIKKVVAGDGPRGAASKKTIFEPTLVIRESSPAIRI